MFERIHQMLVKEFIQVFRDRQSRMIVFVTPVIQLMLFGYAVSTDVRHVATAVLDRDNTVASRGLLDRFVSSGYFTITHHVDSEREAEALLDEGAAACAIILYAGFEADLDAGHTARVQVLLDGSDSNTASIVGSYTAEIAATYSRSVLLDRLTRSVGAVRAPGGVTLDLRSWFNENLDSRNFYVPGVMASLVAIISLMLTSMAVVREKEIGTMEQIIATPMRQVEFIIGKTIPFAIIGYIDVLIIIVVGVYWFGVPMRGSLALLLLAMTLYLMSTLGAGLLISTICNTQQQAMMTTILFINPVMMLSGFIFPIANMPTVIQWITYLNPLRYILVIIRGIFLKGVGLDVLWTQYLALFLLGSAALFIATRRFHKTVA
jgi:ABC-2 type transport system permease protein